MLTTDGPFTEGKEHIGGFPIVKAPDLDAALEWGRKLARATTLPIEVRPFREDGAALIRGMQRVERAEIERVFREEYGRAVAVLVRSLRRHRRRRGSGPGRVHRGRAAVAVHRTAAEPGRMDHHDRAQPRDRPVPPRGVARGSARPGRSAATRGDEPAEEDVVRDDRLRLIFTCCHPALAPGVQVALTLRLLGGLTTAEIARAFLVPETTMAQRLVRAKGKIRDARIPYQGSRARPTFRAAFARCWRSSTSYSTRATRRARASGSSARICARKPSASDGSSRS